MKFVNLELQAAIDRAEAKRKELENQQPAAKASAKVLTLLPRAAEEYRRQVARGLDGDPRAALKARVPARVVRRENQDGAATGRRAHGALESERNCAIARLRTCGSGGVSCISSTPDFVDISLR